MLDRTTIEFKVSDAPVPYEEALAFQEQRVADIIAGKAGPCVWFLEHPPLYTAGTSAKPNDLLDKDALPVYVTGRGGEYTYHGPGQLVAYVMMDLKPLFAPSAPDLRAYIARLESWIIATLAEFGVEGFIKEAMIGVWVDDRAELENEEKSVDSMSEPAMSVRSTVSWDAQQAHTGDIKKIAAIGVRVRKWVAYHGICINVQPNLAHYQGIVPCGIADFGVTSCQRLGVNTTMEQLRQALRQHISCIS